MKRNYIKLSLIALAFLCLPGNAQQITVAPAHVICDYEIPEKLDNQVKSKIQRALTAYGISSEIGMSSFSMVPEVTINDEHTSTTVPVYCDVDFDLTISLKDVYTNKVFATFTKNGIGRGANKSNAIAKGVTAIPLNTSEFRGFCESAKEKVKSYYNSQMPAIIAKAEAAAKSRDFAQALGLLSEIPEECDNYDVKIAPLMGKYYQQEIDLEGEKILSDAKAAWAQSPNETGAQKVASILERFPPHCSSSAGAASLLEQIRKRVQALEERKFAFEKQQVDRVYSLAKQQQANSHAERMSSISAARAIGVAWAKNQPKRITKVYLW